MVCQWSRWQYFCWVRFDFCQFQQIQIQYQKNTHVCHNVWLQISDLNTRGNTTSHPELIIDNNQSLRWSLYKLQSHSLSHVPVNPIIVKSWSSKCQKRIQISRYYLSCFQYWYGTTKSLNCNHAIKWGSKIIVATSIFTHFFIKLKSSSLSFNSP